MALTTGTSISITQSWPINLEEASDSSATSNKIWRYGSPDKTFPQENFLHSSVCLQLLTYDLSPNGAIRDLSAARKLMRLYSPSSRIVTATHSFLSFLDSNVHTVPFLICGAVNDGFG